MNDTRPSGLSSMRLQCGDTERQRGAGVRGLSFQSRRWLVSDPDETDTVSWSFSLEPRHHDRWLGRSASSRPRRRCHFLLSCSDSIQRAAIKRDPQCNGKTPRPMLPDEEEESLPVRSNQRQYIFRDSALTICAMQSGGVKVILGSQRCFSLMMIG